MNFQIEKKSWNLAVVMLQLSAISIILSTFLQLDKVGAASIDGSNTGYYLQLYNSINSFRTKHTVPALRWNRTLTEVAEYAANRILTATITFDIEEMDGINFFIIPGTEKPSPTSVAETWYKESRLYDFNNPGLNIATFNFTQMIWKNSIYVGLGVYSANNYTSIVAKFYPPGNVRGKFRQNVIPKYKKP